MSPTMLGPYRLDALLGRGGMGEVYQAYDTEQDRRVALKVLPAALSRDPQYRGRFRREAKLACGLTDPHVVPIHRYGEIDGQLFLDMRLVDGDDLEEVLRHEGRLAPEAAVRLVEQVASALDAAHREGLVHRDVKPSNVFLTRPGGPDAPRFAYLGDFGIARNMTGTASAVLTAAGTAIGTPDYMAPERFAGDAVDGRADVYALAGLLHEALTGERPFVRDGLAALMHAHMFSPPPRPSAHAGVPAGFDAVVARGMAKEPAQRQATAGELATQARAVLAAAGTVPTPTPTVDLADTATNRLAVVPGSGPRSLPTALPAPPYGPPGGSPSAGSLPRITPPLVTPPPFGSSRGTPLPPPPGPWAAAGPVPPGPGGPPYPGPGPAFGPVTGQGPGAGPARPLPVSAPALLCCVAAGIGLLVPVPALNVLGFCVLVPVLGAAALRNRNPLAGRPEGWVLQQLLPLAVVLTVVACGVAGVLAAVLADTARLQGTLVVLSLLLVAGWAASRRR